MYQTDPESRERYFRVPHFILSVDFKKRFNVGNIIHCHVTESHLIVRDNIREQHLKKVLELSWLQHGYYAFVVIPYESAANPLSEIITLLLKPVVFYLSVKCYRRYGVSL